MSSRVTVDMFVEDRAHEALLRPLVQRIAREEGIGVTPQVRSARGGRGRVIDELKLYQRLVMNAGEKLPDLLIVAIDGNCTTFTKMVKTIKAEVLPAFSAGLVMACPDPHIERWYLVDPESFKEVVGHQPTIGKKKCVRDYYKDTLANAVRKAGHPATLGGIEFASELVERMDLFRAGKNERSLKRFMDRLRSQLRTVRAAHGGGAG